MPRLVGAGCAIGVMLSTAVASASPVYQLYYGNPEVVDTVTTTPQRVTHGSSDAYASYAEWCYAIPGRVMARVHMVDSGYGSDHAQSYAGTDDFVISGPAGPTDVNATVFFRVHLDLEHAGTAKDNSTRAYGNFFFQSEHDGYIGFVMGDASSGNGSTSGDGALAAYAGGATDTTVSFTTSLPAGVPFGISLSVDAVCRADSIATVDGYFAGELGDSTGHVMDLPAGYTVNSTSWGVVDDCLTSQATAVAGALRGRLMLSLVTPNPSRGRVSLSYELPRDGRTRLDIVDVQGRDVRTVVCEDERAGTHELAWDGRDASGHPLGAGIYFARLALDGLSVSRRFVSLR